MRPATCSLKLVRCELEAVTTIIGAKRQLREAHTKVRSTLTTAGSLGQLST